MKKILFIDRDGTIIKEPADEQIDSLEKLEFLPAVLRNLYEIAKSKEYKLVMVTNQDGLGTSSFPEHTFHPAHNKMLNILENEGIIFDEILIDKTFPHEKSPNRKPEIGLVTHYLNNPNFDIQNSFVIGDRFTDIQLAKNLGCKGILIAKDEKEISLKSPELVPFCALISDDWTAIKDFLSAPRAKFGSRIGKVKRTTKETDIDIEIDLDGTGKADIHTGIDFFDHMLEQIARHGEVDLKIQTKGDLHIDEHHTIEDTALALGEALLKAFGDKRGIERYGFCLPMDEVLAQVAIDFGGRPWLVWDADFKREKIGDMPTEMFMHFFKSLSDTSKTNINIKAEPIDGANEHHKIEAIFKAFAKALKMAKTHTGSNELPSTKGVL